MPRPAPDLPLATDYICRTLYIPNDLLFIGAVNDALIDLGYSEHWSQNGEEMAQAGLDMFQRYSDSTGVCMFGKIDFFPLELPANHLPMDGTTYEQADYPMLVPKIPASWKSGTQFTLPDIGNRYLKIGNTFSDGGRDSFSISEDNIPLINISYNGSVVSASLEGAGVPVPSAIHAPLSTSIGYLTPNEIELDPSYLVLIAGIFATF